MRWCETNGVDYVLGVSKDSRLKAVITEEMAPAKSPYEETEPAARVFKDFRYRTRTRGSCERRVTGKAEHLAKGEEPRFVVTTLSTEDGDARSLYADGYCARGDRENRIKEQPLARFADRTSTHEMRSNPLRLYFSAFAYVLMQTLRRRGLNGTSLARAPCDTIRLKRFKTGAHIRSRVRRVRLAFSESDPHVDWFRQVLYKRQRIPLRCSFRIVSNDYRSVCWPSAGGSLPDTQKVTGNQLLHGADQYTKGTSPRTQMARRISSRLCTAS